jgi:UDP:flavonoid glycosyltransferase YjiC (YdhE family)
LKQDGARRVEAAMAKIVFTWELGGGLGHLVRYRALVTRLCGEGHAVTFIARDAERARGVFGHLPVTLEPAPWDSTPPALRIAGPNSFAEVLWNSGFAEREVLSDRLRQWSERLDAARPDVVVADYSPTAVLAGRHLLGIRTIASGSGFYLPPALRPLPPLRYWQSADREGLTRSEAALLANLNAALLALGGRPVPSVVDGILTGESFLQSFEEFDHVYARQDADYLGAYPSASFGLDPEWPAGEGPKLFAYLEPSVLLPELLGAFAALDVRVCLYAPGADPALAARSGRVRWMPGPVALAHAAAEADACVSNANINSMMAFLLAGKPQFVVPYTLEKYLVGRRLEILGAGLSAPRRNTGDLVAKLRAVLTQRQYRRAAERFASKYAGGDESTHAAEMWRRLGLGDTPENIVNAMR